MSPPELTTARALLTLARITYDRTRLAGRITHDAADVLLRVVEQWCEGIATDSEVRAARKIARVARPTLARANIAMRDLLEVAYDLAGCVGGGPGVHRGRCARSVVDGVERCLRRLGEPREVARWLVVTMFEVARSGTSRSR